MCDGGVMASNVAPQQPGFMFVSGVKLEYFCVEFVCCILPMGVNSCLYVSLAIYC